MQVAETIQTAHINRAPSAQHDLNPSTAADMREPVHLEKDAGDEDEDDIPVSVLRPARRFSHLPPIPDLRFEQSYLHSIQDAKSWWMVAWITTRDQVRFRRPMRVIDLDQVVADANHIPPFAASDAHVAGCRLQPGLVRLAVLEQERTDERELDRCTGSEVVVGCQQLAHSLEAGSKGEEGLVPSMSSIIKSAKFDTDQLPLAILDPCSSICDLVKDPKPILVQPLPSSEACRGNTAHQRPSELVCRHIR